MKDTFTAEIGRLIRPMEELGPLVPDTTFFLKNTGSFVYAEGYWHPPGAFYGKIIDYPCAEGTFEVHGRRYERLTMRVENGTRLLVPHDVQLQMQYRVDPGLKPPPAKPVITGYHHPFELQTMQGWFCGHRSMEAAIERYPETGRRIRELAALFDVPLERLGVTGPLAYGWEEDRALNLVFSGTPEENAETARKIRRLTYTDSKRRIVEYGKFWPLRLAHDGVPVCCFFVYADRGRIPVCGQGIELVREPVEAFGTVVDTLHSLYMPLVLRLGDAYLDGAPAGEIDLIIADSSLRGEFYPNERVHITRGRLVRLSGNGASAEAIVALDAGDIEKERFVKGVPAF
ncbi:MAG: hypothetical protein IT574_06505 [Candidatus Aureabacteria bacterium]|nr:hypothetical protein [Candidatus Auribacterota bacterium]